MSHYRDTFTFWLGSRAEARKGNSMRILVTNDDGIDAPGLSAVAAALVSAGHSVSVGAPLVENSGSGSSLGTLEDGAIIECAERQLDGLPGVPAYAFDCPPAFVVLAFCAGQFGPPPEFVVSGINPGYNTGRSVLFSSTVGAVLTGQVAGIGGLAMSCGFAPTHRFDTAAGVATRMVEWIERNQLRAQTFNVNVPDVDFADLAGTELTTLGTRSLMGLRMSRTDRGVELRRYDNTRGLGEGTDSAAVAAGLVSVTPISSVCATAVSGPMEFDLPAALLDLNLIAS